MARQVDFYVIGESSDAARLRLACRLAERAYLAGHRVLAWAGTDAEAEALDSLLWTFGDGSFVPHEPLGESADAPVQITASDGTPPGAVGFDVLLNLRAAAVPDTVEIERIVEVIDGEARRRQEGRDRFRAYRESGVAPTHHNIENESQIGNG
ncbi:MAG: hypothetical protein RLZZ200_813 [Pseudomonadota bacterium]|jgi:DNA polymerase-3 subunit chi